MTKNLKWRLGKLPTPSELVDLVNSKIITQDEAKEILFSVETQEDRDKASLEAEIKFLRDLVEKLSQSRTQIVEVIKEIKVPYYRLPWYKQYDVWCYASQSNVSNLAASAGHSATILNASNFDSGSVPSFRDIKTF